MAACKDSFMVEAKSTTPSPRHLTFLTAHLILRGLAVLLSAASIAVTVTNAQTVIIFSIQFQAHYYYSSAFKFLVAAEAIVCAFSVLTFVILYLKRQPIPQLMTHHYFFLFLHDTVMTVLMISGCAAATAIGYVGQFGESHMGWAAICGSVGKFCRTNMVSLFLSYLAFFAYLALTLLTPYTFVSSSSSSNPQN